MRVSYRDALGLDANGLPIGHHAARDIAARTLRDWINDLPNTAYHLNLTDAEDVADVMLIAYITALKLEQRR
jgi:hypothetical protein